MIDESTQRFLNSIDEQVISSDLRKSINEIYKKIATMVTLQRDLLIYKLIKNNYVRMKDMEEASGYSRQRIYDIINAFEKREIERQNEQPNA